MSEQNASSSSGMTEEIQSQIWESACSLYAWHRTLLTAPDHQAECRENIIKYAENIVRLGGIVSERKDGTGTIFPSVSYAAGVLPLEYDIGRMRGEKIFAGLAGVYTR